MSATPPARRRLNPAVTVRRAQSERRQLSPWQLPWSRGRTSGPETGRDPRDPPWGRVDHHHTPRTALIPPALPRMVGHSQSVLCGGLSPAGSMRHLPMAPVPSVQLPPIALGSPPTMLPPPHTLEDRLSQDRLSAFLAGEILPHQPRSILSCPGDSSDPLVSSVANGTSNFSVE
ncbi:hypothetical protein Pmani_037242 [Petrolisthes manimaculis]|uniref:Uncharacterized protein n=1 Tax=Petrolisthes manimaculis TaxID=1843537 RepID=A0AAE1NGN5_9EUCA|nr:hypothetical protein Pmani_037242 [Petrolisthes manimaculis]